jgi:hypothetical protein
MRKVLALVALILVPVVADAKDKDLETTHLFGFTLGSDVNDVGEKEAETETTGRFAKGGAYYTAVEQAAAIKFIPFQNFPIEPGLAVAYHGISGVPGLDDRQQMAFNTATLEMRYRILNREHAPIGLTLGDETVRPAIDLREKADRARNVLIVPGAQPVRQIEHEFATLRQRQWHAAPQHATTVNQKQAGDCFHERRLVGPIWSDQAVRVRSPSSRRVA